MQTAFKQFPGLQKMMWKVLANEIALQLYFSSYDSAVSLVFFAIRVTLRKHLTIQTSDEVSSRPFLEKRGVLLFESVFAWIVYLRIV